MTQSAEGPLSRHDLVGHQLHLPRHLVLIPSIPGLLRPPLQLSPGNCLAPAKARSTQRLASAAAYHRVCFCL